MGTPGLPPSTTIPSPGYGEDTPHVSGDSGVPTLAVRNDTPGSLVDTNGDYAPLQVDANGRLRVDATLSGASGGTAMADDAAFTVGTTNITPAGGTYRTSRDNLDDGDGGAIALNQKRGQYVTLENSSSTEIGVSGSPLRIDPTGTTTQPVSGPLTDTQLRATPVDTAFQVASSTNNTTTPLSGGATYTGTAELSRFPDVMVTCKADVAGTLFLEFSESGSFAGEQSTFPTNGFQVTANTYEFHTAVKGLRYFRARYVNGSAAQSSFRLTTTFGAYAKEPNSPLNQTLAKDTDAGVVKAVNYAVNHLGLCAPAQNTIDLFGRVRVSDPFQIFGSKQIFDNQPLLWDDQQETGSGTTSTFSANAARSRLAVSATTAGKRTRQTFRSFDYQPGKPLLIFMTGVLDVEGSTTGIIQRIGYFNDKNGLFFENNAGTVRIVRRTFVSGSAVDNAVAQSSWNLDTMDGSGNAGNPSGLTLDRTKANIFGFTFEWLGVGAVQYFLVINGEIVPVHIMNHANALSTVYMSTPNLPLRYQIINDGTGAAASLDSICSTVIVEGGRDPEGILRSFSTDGVHVDANVADTVYAVVGIRLKSAYIGARIQIIDVSMICETADDFEVLLYFNPTVAGTFTYADQTNSALQKATGATANTVTGGTLLLSEWAKSASQIAASLDSTIRLGASIAGTVDTIVLCVRPLSAAADIQGSINLREVI